MATATAMKIKEIAPNVLRLQHFTWQRSALLGAGLAYAWTEGKWWHAPLIVVAPSIYAGYQAFKGRDQIRAFISQEQGNDGRITSGPAPGETHNYSHKPTHV